jgi:hypothetical protein
MTEIELNGFFARIDHDQPFAKLPDAFKEIML